MSRFLYHPRAGKTDHAFRFGQVDIADVYDHKHQQLSPQDVEQGLSKMSTDIAKALFRKLATNGEVFSTEKIENPHHSIGGEQGALGCSQAYPTALAQVGWTQ